jgi:hypothetical protein
MTDLPHWEDGTVTILATSGGPAHAIPVSTALRAGPRTILLALALRRESLARLREDPRVALSIMGADVACTAHATAQVVEEPLAESPGVAAVRLDVHALQDHRTPRFTMLGPVAWAWSDEEARARDATVRAGLRRLAAQA